MKIKNISIAALPLLLGVTAFLIVVGPRVLNPTNIAWLEEGDSATHYLGWLFYRQSDWSFPIGLNPDYGLELGNAILYSDSNMLLAILFKPFSSVLPEPFQYFGLWLLACFVLQAWFGWKLVGLISKDIGICLIGGGLFVFSPPMLLRLSGHSNLVGHFLVLAALYLTLRPATAKRLLPWGAVLVTAALVHAYLLAMVAILWLADLSWRTINSELAIQRSPYEIVFLTTAVGFVCWQAGYFSVGASGLSGIYGTESLNLLSIVDPYRWSYVLRKIPGFQNIDDNFLGLGAILLGFFSLPYLLSGRAKLSATISRKPILLLTLIGLTLFALSNKIGIGPYTFEYSLPDALLRAAGIFQASGRMFWPVFYALLFTLIFLVVRGNDKRTATYLLALALVVQVTDSSGRWLDIRRKKLMIAPASEWETVLQDPFWLEAATKYKKVRIIPPPGKAPIWKIVASYAGTFGLKTNAIYLARVDRAALESVGRKSALSLRTGAYDPDSLYIIDSSVLKQAALTLNLDADLLFQIDGFNVLAPGWKNCGECQRVSNQLKILDLLPSLRLGERIQFDNSGKGAAFLLGGWTSAEAEGTWSNGQNAEMVLPLPDNAQGILIEAGASVSPSHPGLDVEIRFDGMLAMSTQLTAGSENSIEVPIPTNARKELTSRDIMQIQFNFPDAARPTDLGDSRTTRKPALLLQAMTVF